MRLKSMIFAVAASLSLASAAPGRADESGVTVAMKPLQAVSLDLGSRHVVSYFVTREGRCDLTVLTAARFDANAVAAPGDVQRLRFRVEFEQFRAARFARSGIASIRVRAGRFGFDPHSGR